jgi:hypothetical protein
MALVQWEIDFERIPTNLTDVTIRERLKVWGDAGWEPYTIVGVTHFFKRHVEVVHSTTIPAKKNKK